MQALKICLEGAKSARSKTPKNLPSLNSNLAYSFGSNLRLIVL
jgi:hypothetical protein